MLRKFRLRMAGVLLLLEKKEMLPSVQRGGLVSGRYAFPALGGIRRLYIWGDAENSIGHNPDRD